MGLVDRLCLPADRSDAPDPEKTDTVMLLRHRVSRIWGAHRIKGLSIGKATDKRYSKVEV